MIDSLKLKLSDKSSKQISFWFVRHAQSEQNVLGSQSTVMNDAPLTKSGGEQALAIVKYFHDQGVQISDVYSSPLERSSQTATAIAAAFNLSVKVKADLGERDWGHLKDQTWQEVSDKISKMDIEERYTFTPDGGESWLAMERRLFKALEEIAQESTLGENVVIVTHKGCLRAILPVLAKASKDEHERFSVETGSLTKFSFDKEAFDFVGLVP